MLAWQSLGCDVVSFDTTPYVRDADWLSRQLGYRFSTGPAIERLNRDLRQWADRHRGRGGCVWVDKGVWISADTLSELKASTGAVLLHYTPDPQVLYRQRTLPKFLSCLSIYDLLVTTKPYEVAEYRKRGAREVILLSTRATTT